jgi:hypothetical protein
MPWRAWAVLAGAGLLLAGLLVYWLRVACLRVEIVYDRPQGEEEVCRVRLWLPPLVAYQLRRRPQAPGVRAEAEPRRDWSRVLSEGWAAVREIQTVRRTLFSLARHELAFLAEDRSLRRGVVFALRVLERVPWRTEELSWVTRVGAGDPALTGILSGLLWSFKGAIFGVLAERMAFVRRPVVRVQPDFEGVAFRTALHCIVRARVRDIIAAGAGVWRRKREGPWRTNTRSKA